MLVFDECERSQRLRVALAFVDKQLSTGATANRLYEIGRGVKWGVGLVVSGPAGGVGVASCAHVSIAPAAWGLGEMGGSFRRRKSIESRQAARR